jgi:hypothetical protein
MTRGNAGKVHAGLEISENIEVSRRRADRTPSARCAFGHRACVRCDALGCQLKEVTLARHEATTSHL